MKVLLTGANGFVGSHILDALRAREIATVVLLRQASNRQYINPHLPALEVRLGLLNDPASLDEAMRDVTHVIHCAGMTKALRAAEFLEVNRMGTRQVVQAVNKRASQIQRLVHISSLAVAGPSLPNRPSRESDPPRPVSSYGLSKLAGEQEVREGCKIPFVILRPPSVYGPRDLEFLRVFQAVKSHLLPRLGSGRQALSLLFVKDLAEVVVASLTHPKAEGETFYVAPREIVTTRMLGDEVAAQMGRWTLPLPLPLPCLWPVFILTDAWSWLTGKPNGLGLKKHVDLRAPAWVCEPAKLEEKLGIQCAIGLKPGIAASLKWYREQGWI